MGVESGGVARSPCGRLVLDGVGPGSELFVQAVDGGLVYLVHLAEIHPFEDVPDLLDVAVDIVPGGESLGRKVPGLVSVHVDEADAVADRVGHEVRVVLGVVAGDVEHGLVLVLQGLEDVFQMHVPDRFGDIFEPVCGVRVVVSHGPDRVVQDREVHPDLGELCRPFGILVEQVLEIGVELEGGLVAHGVRVAVPQGPVHVLHGEPRGVGAAAERPDELVLLGVYELLHLKGVDVGVELGFSHDGALAGWFPYFLGVLALAG